LFYDLALQLYLNFIGSKIQMETALESLEPFVQFFALRGERLTTTYHLEHLCAMKTVDLSHNALRHLRTGFLLQNVIELNLNNNQIVDCQGLKRLPKLEILNLSNNDIKETKDLASLSSCPRLHTVHLGGNPVTRLPDFAAFSLGQVKFVCT
jgi:Leucine-rich repeat (LRR) protein